jgi:hypothetical protein
MEEKYEKEDLIALLGLLPRVTQWCLQYIITSSADSIQEPYQTA